MRAEQQRCRAGDPLLHGRRVEGRVGQSMEVEASRWPDPSADEMRGRGAHRVNGWEVAKHAVKTFVKAVPARVSVSEALPGLVPLGQGRVRPLLLHGVLVKRHIQEVGGASANPRYHLNPRMWWWLRRVILGL